MAGTVQGGKQAAQTNKERHGANFYSRIGKLGGAKGTTGGFAATYMCDCELIEGTHPHQRCAGKKGGMKSRRGKRDEKVSTS